MGCLTIYNKTYFLTAFLVSSHPVSQMKEGGLTPRPFDSHFIRWPGLELQQKPCRHPSSVIFKQIGVDHYVITWTWKKDQQGISVIAPIESAVAWYNIIRGAAKGKCRLVAWVVCKWGFDRTRLLKWLELAPELFGRPLRIDVKLVSPRSGY